MIHYCNGWYYIYQSHWKGPQLQVTPKFLIIKIKVRGYTLRIWTSSPDTTIYYCSRIKRILVKRDFLPFYSSQYYFLSRRTLLVSLLTDRWLKDGGDITEIITPSSLLPVILNS
uniref:Uncharacterized protein n=1 Tax=Morchella brunnea TaxID=1174671 RepID=A0A8K1I7R8_9PEZI|nr:hypothetical protein LK370_mgp259 [Morchella brunnea]UBU98483.1 hypothetical protein [Morchella brunnea]